MPSALPDNFHHLLDTMKRASARLREAEIEFMLGGGLAIWARGGPPTDHDVDFYLRERDVESAFEVLVDAGFRGERPPEEWLLKIWDGDHLVDLIHRPAGGEIDDEHFARASELEVSAQRVLVASIDDVLVMKLLADLRAGAGLPGDPRDRPCGPRAGGLDARRGAHADIPIRAGLLHAGRGARDRGAEDDPRSRAHGVGLPEAGAE